MKASIACLLVALGLRIAASFIVGEPTDTDSLANRANSRDLELVLNPHGISSVWSHNPGLILFAHLCHDFFTWAQITVGALTCWLLFRKNPWAGWLWALWPAAIVSCFVWHKWVLAGFVFSAMWILIRRHWAWGFLCAPVYVALFANKLGYNFLREGVALWKNLTGFFAPATEVGGIFLGPAGAVAGLLWIGWIIAASQLWKHFDVLSRLLLVGLCLAAIAFFGVAQQRLPFEPVLWLALFDAWKRSRADSVGRS